ncbi:2-oxoglutarate and iron-dependent oxygenase domain-containing protein [Caulobacter sp. NIBR1757]|uniref:isopenicillin N synthase family dioxygenase n=1 Tax=Caulobacter sp. NIBR1757 TaxID=3016000 RepID=UPI0022F0FA09|nr:2-oxoglutarate and iron-dependent oxygenase domain-containing protein [Caulobacter sp. NIBR1757]WGM39947.1 Validamycin A dioxygenase [Caulobacter sp. NIBR1757]
MDQSLPIIDVSPLFGDDAAARARVAARIGEACRSLGFFYVSGHGVSDAVFAELDRQSRAFFALPEADKAAIAMSRGGRAWRGWFPLGGELTSGQPDRKEGLYLGQELPADDPRVQAGLPMHGANLWPEALPALRPAVEAFMAGTARAAHAVLEGVALSLGLSADYFARAYTADPTVLFRIFHYPAAPAGDAGWGVGEHTDYGLLTLLAQDKLGGLQVKTPSGWIEAPPVPGAFVCNIGDMLDRLTGGEFRSTPHRVRNTSGRDRLSFPLFFDPAFDAVIRPLPGREKAPPGERWDGVDPAGFAGTYGDYLLGKVGKVFPELGAAVISAG